MKSGKENKKVSRMVDMQEVSIAVASASVVAGIVYYAFQIRHQTRLRESDVILRLSSFWSLENEKALSRVFGCEFKDYEDFVKRYGSFSAAGNNPEQELELKESIGVVLTQMETMGLLLKRKVVDADLMYEIYPAIRLWEKVKPIVEGARKELNDPELWRSFEYYYNEMKKEQKREQSKKG